MNTGELEQLENHLEEALKNIRSTKVTLLNFNYQFYELKMVLFEQQNIDNRIQYCIKIYDLSLLMILYNNNNHVLFH